ncbi:DUF3784 domain-containing protein [Natronospora cellulosivora (SeqCode)]
MRITLIIATLPLLILGFLIWKFEIVDIIAGYDESKTKDKSGLAKWVGRNLLIMGALLLLLIIIDIYLNLSPSLILILMLLIMGVISIFTAMGTKKYEK